MEIIPIIVAYFLLSCSVGFGIIIVVWSFLSKGGGGRTRRRSPSSEADGNHTKNKQEEEDIANHHGSLENGTVLTLMTWSGLTCCYRNAEENVVTTLHDAYGELKTGELTAIMGPSGAGKSTLLDILSGRKTVGKVSGKISMFGQTITEMPKAIGILRDVAAYIPQDVSFLPMQTAEEAVRFVACLKHGRDGLDMTAVHQILNDVGLNDSELYSRPIGGELVGGLTVRGLSGGEKKRLALACALAIKPKLMMLDEITSGLDSENAEATMKLVKRVCVSHEMAAVVVIHQPNGYIFQTFDRLILLSRGRCIFSDPVSKLEQLYDGHFGCPMPLSTHEIPLDLLRKLRDCNANNLPDINKDRDYILGSFSEPLALPETTHKNISFAWKLGVVFHRNLTNHYIRNLTNLGARLLIYSCCSVLDGVLFWKVGAEQESATVGAFTFIILVSYLLPFSTIAMFIQEKKFFLCEREMGLYPPAIYCICQGLLELWVLTLAAAAQTAIVVPMCGLWNPVQSKHETFFVSMSALMASNLVGSNLILFFSILMPSQDFTFLVGAGTACFSLGLSGGFVPFSAIRSFSSWLQWISPCKYSLQALTIGMWQDSVSGDVMLEAMALNRPATISANIAILFLMYALCSVGTMILLYTKRNQR